MTNKPETLGGYIKKILDVNKDGQITFKDFLGLFPNQAVAIAVLFVDLVVLVAEYRVWDVGMKISGDPFKAIGFVLISAVPFYLGQLFWLYPHAGLIQKIIALGFVVGGLYTSAQFGLADLSKQYDVALIVALVIRLTVVYIAAALSYILVDTNIKAWRSIVTAQAAVDQEMRFQTMTRQMLAEWQKTKTLERETIDLFGDEDAVITQLNALRGKGSPKVSYAQTVVKPADNTLQQPPDVGAESHWYSLEEWLKITKSERQQAREHWGVREYREFAEYTSKAFEPRFISGKNMRQIYNTLLERDRDFTQAPHPNGKK